MDFIILIKSIKPTTITMCDVIKPYFKHTILPDDVVKLISKYLEIKERFSIRYQMLRLFENPCPALYTNYTDHDEDGIIDINNQITRYEYSIYWDLIELLPWDNHCDVCSIDTHWKDTYADKVKFVLEDILLMDTDDLSYDLQLLKQAIIRALVFGPVDISISKIRYDKIDWAKFVKMHYRRRCDYFRETQYDDAYTEPYQDWCDLNMFWD